jgi:hypothetical protein
VKLVQLESSRLDSFPAKISRLEILQVDGMNVPVIALPTLICLAEALMQRQIMSYAVLPSRICHLKVGMLLLQRAIEIAQTQFLFRRLQNSLGDQLDVGGVRLSV